MYTILSFPEHMVFKITFLSYFYWNGERTSEPDFDESWEVLCYIYNFGFLHTVLIRKHKHMVLGHLVVLWLFD